MTRSLAIVIGAIVGGLLGAVGLMLYIDLTYINYTRDSGVPAAFTGMLLGGPPGLIAGAILGAIWPIRR